MTGYESKRAAAQDKLDDDDALTIAYQSGYYDGKKAAQPAQEPVAWMHVMDNTEGLKVNGTGVVSITKRRKHPFGKAGVDFSKSYPVISTPLYTTPPQRLWVGLTDEEIKEIHSAAEGQSVGVATGLTERKLKEKNT